MPYISSSGEIQRTGGRSHGWIRRGSSHGASTWQSKLICLGFLLLLAFFLNPTHDSLNTFLDHRTPIVERGYLGIPYLADAITRKARRVSYTRSLFWSEASSGSECFVGLLGFWITDPRSIIPLSRNLASIIGSISGVDFLAGAYAAVFLAWCFLPGWTMFKHFTLSRHGVAAGRWHTLATCSVSHAEPAHLLMNLAALLSVGAEVEGRLGLARFIALYAVSALAGSAASLLGHATGDYHSLGGSGGLFGLSGFLATTARPDYRVIMYGQNLTAPEALVANVVLGAALARRGGTDNWAHAGGAFAGAVIFPRLLEEVPWL